ncbi:MAG: hypothetical protein LBL47_01975 [Lactobacillus sp.]|jgi:hypothetical protein|nr:hypothetical protein [Lactobacillus sp.]
MTIQYKNSWEEQIIAETIGDIFYRDTFGGWKSPPELFDNELEEKGFKYSDKMAFQYQYPENMSAKEYEESIEARYSLYFYRKLPEDSNLFKKYGSKLKERQPQKRLEIKKEFEELRNLNPELAEINIDNKNYDEMYNILWGVSSKIPPHDIKFYVEEWMPNREENSGHPMMDKYKEEIQSVDKDLGPSYILSPKSRDKLRNIVSNKDKTIDKSNKNEPNIR